MRCCAVAGLLLVPLGVWRPLATGQALRGRPLKQARRTYSAGVEGVPGVAARARPPVVPARRPVAQRAADTGPGAVATFVGPDDLTKLGIQKSGHAPPVSHSTAYGLPPGDASPRLPPRSRD